MSIFVPNKVYLRGILLHYFIQKKSAAEAHRILVQTYGDNALSDTTCRDWFRRFKNNDFELEDKERSGAPKKFQDKELEQLLDEDPSQTLSELGKILQVDESTVSKRLKGLGMIQKQGHWVPYELKPRDVERRFGTCELLLQRQKRKGFLRESLPTRDSSIGDCLPSFLPSLVRKDEYKPRAKLANSSLSINMVQAYAGVTLIKKGAVGGEGGDEDDKEKEEEAERERQEAIREAEERRKEKHRKMEEEREKMRQEIRDKYNIKKREEVQEMPQEEPNPLMRKKKTPEELAAEAEAEEEDEFTKLRNTIETQVNEIKSQIESKCSLQ
ncbi:MOS1T transposase, partial [Pseudoatta argentina]